MRTWGSGFAFSFIPFQWLFLFLVLAAFCAAEAQPTAEPSSLTFNSSSERQLVRLSLDGQPLAPEAVRGWTLLAGEGSYTHMVSISLTREGLLIGPSATVEVGSYLLVINTDHGPVHLDIKTPLTQHKSVLETRAEELGVSIDIVREQLGFSQRFERQNVELRLPPTYYVGDMLEVEMPQYDTVRCVWKVNGVSILEGVGQSTLRHLLTVPGSLEVLYEEWKDSTLLASARANAQVLQVPAMQLSVQTNTIVTFNGPPDYAVYSWYVDNELCCHEQTIKHVFYNEGTAHVLCVCTQPQKDGLKEYREIVYLVNVE